MPTDDDGNVFTFPRIGLRPPVGTDAPAGPAVDEAPSEPSPTPLFPQLPARRLAPPAGFALPALVSTDPEPQTAGTPSASSTSGRDAAALSLLTLAAISTAALRGTYHVVSWIRNRAEHHRTVNAKAKDATGKDAASKRIQSGPEFGRSARRAATSSSTGQSKKTGAPATFRSSKSSSAASKPKGGPLGTPSRGRTASGPSKSASSSAGQSAKPTAGRKSSAATAVKAGRKGALTARRGGEKDASKGSPRKSSGLTLRKASAAGKPGAVVAGKSKPGQPGAASSALTKGRKPGAAATTGARGTAKTPPTSAKQKAMAGKGTSKPARNKARKAHSTWKPRPPMWQAPNPSKPKAGTKAGPGKPPGFAKAKATARDRWQRTNAKRGTGPTTPPPGPSGAHRGSTRPTGGPSAGRGRPTPPPSMTEHTVTLARIDQDQQSRTQPSPAAAITASRGALTTGTASTKGPHVTAPPAPVPTPAPVPQPSGDSDLTIYDLVDADNDASREILDRVDEAKNVAVATEKLLTHLENYRARVIALNVPGSLLGYLNRLMENAALVRNDALGLAAALPQASEAISAAGTNAASRHQRLADATRDAGHRAPAEADYNKE